MSNPAASPKPRTTDYGLRTAFVIPIFLCVLSWFAHFSHFHELGLYEDDHYFAARAMNWNGADAWQWVRDNSAFPGDQGRPVGFILGAILPYAGYHLDGLPGMFVVAYLVFALNVNLFYFLLRRCLAEPIPVIAAIGFILFPADTTRPFLNHAHILQPSITFVLLACHCFLNRNWLSHVTTYVLIVLSLLTYESAPLMAVFFPFLARRWDQYWLRRFAIHGLVMASLFASVGIIRSKLGEARSAGALADRKLVVQKIEQYTPIGLRTVRTALRARAKQGLDEALSEPVLRPLHPETPDYRLLDVMCGLSMVAAVVWATWSTARTEKYWLLPWNVLRCGLYAVPSLAIAYVLSFTHDPPDYALGRMTSTHLATTIPVAVLMAAVMSLPMMFPPRVWGGLLSGGVAACYFPLLFGYAQYEQMSYGAIWHARQDFWIQVIDLCPDLKDGTLVIVDGGIPRPEYYLDSNSWSDYMILGQVWDFHGKKFGRDPMLFCFRRNPDTDAPTWQKGITHVVGGPFLFHDAPEGLQKDSPVFSGNTILLHSDDLGNVTRQTGTIQLRGSDFKLKEPDPAPEEYPKLPMYRILTRRLL